MHRTVVDKHNEDALSDAERQEQRWRALENRLARLERRGAAISGTLASSPYQLARSLLHPRLWTFEQYASRRLRVSCQYRLELPPADAPSIAIVTPSLNQGFSIGATIDSVLQQNYPKLDYLVQDGGSRDETLRILASYGDRLTWRSEADSGQSNAINRGFAAVQGDIMGYLNSDDVLLPGTLAYVAKAFTRLPEVDVVYGHRIYIDADGFEVGRCVLPPHDAEVIKWADYIPQETMFWRRRVWDGARPFDESFCYALDWDFILRAQRAGFRFMRLPRFLAGFRVHEQQKTIDLQEIGIAEMRRLRTRELGEMPGTYEIRRAISGYVLRQMAFDWLYRLGLLRY
jgi:glycosyltransferase involved in cell wall biosynthesis